MAALLPATGVRVLLQLRPCDATDFGQDRASHFVVT
jgi:hypothetical protein